jgi:hypothetical protein
MAVLHASGVTAPTTPPTMTVDRDQTGQRQKEDQIHILFEQLQIESHRRREDQGRNEEIQNELRRESYEPNGLEESEMVLGDRQEAADDDQTYRIGNWDVPERDRRKRSQQQELDDTDDEESDTAFDRVQRTPGGSFWRPPDSGGGSAVE